jgi:hypothetical protein
MSYIESLALDLLATLGPVTGKRASGTVRMVATGDDVTVPRNTFLCPVVGGQLETKYVFKVAEGPNTDRSWTVTGDGTDIDVFSNIGGARHNVAAGTLFRFSPPLIDGISSVTAVSDFTGGSDNTEYGGVRDAVVYESLDGDISVELLRSRLAGLPGIVITWTGSEPSDGTTIPTMQSTRVANGQTLFKEMFAIFVIVDKSTSEAARRGEGLYILEDVTRFLTDRHAIDGRPYSNPQGVHVVRRGRERGPQKLYQRFNVYTVVVTAQRTLCKYDVRIWNDWNTSVIDSGVTQRPGEPDQGDKTVVDNMEVEMQ